MKSFLVYEFYEWLFLMCSMLEKVAAKSLNNMVISTCKNGEDLRRQSYSRNNSVNDFAFYSLFGPYLKYYLTYFHFFLLLA